MTTVTGSSDVRRFIAQLPANLETKVLRGAARAGATVIAEEAKANTNSHEVAEAVKVATKRKGDLMIGAVQLKGPGAYLAPWEEYGTDPHFISVDPSQGGGMSVRRINDKTKEGSLVIGGAFVGKTVHHPGAGAHPFLRPALDSKEGEAFSAAQNYTNSRITRAGIVGPADVEDDA